MKVYQDILLLIKSYLSLYEIKQIFGERDFYKVVKIGNYPKEEIFQNLENFTTCCYKGNLDLVQVYLKYDHKLTQTDMGWAIHGGNLSIVRYLYEECKLNPDQDALIIAVDKKAIHILEYFNKVGMLNKFEFYRREYGNTKIRNILLDYSSFVENQDMKKYLESIN